jgi:molybdopterin converting factor small subunit
MARIKLYGIAKDIVGQEELNIRLERPIQLDELIKRISRSDNEKRIFSREVQVILVNGVNCVFKEGLKTEVSNNDLVEILPIVRGG